MFGLTDEDIKVIQDILQMYPAVDEAILFGSRAMGREKAGSDIDIALKGDKLESIASEVSGQLNEETPLPYFFDILDFASIDNPDLIDHINRMGKVIYTKRN